MSEKETETSGTSITHWFAAAELVKADEFKGLVREYQSKKEEASVKEVGLQFLKDHNLPRLDNITVVLQIFLENPKKFFDQISPKTGFFYTSIIDKERGLRVYGLEQTQQEVETFIREKLVSEKISLDSDLTLSEYRHNYYGGNLLINERGEVLIELVEGKHAKLKDGKGPILLSAETTKYTETLRFRENQEIDEEAIIKLRQAILCALNLIPKQLLSLIKNSLTRFQEIVPNENWGVRVALPFIENQEIDEETNIKLRQAIVDALNLIPKQLVPLSKNPLTRFKEIVYNEDGEACVAVPYSGYFEFILTKETPDAKDWQVIFIDARTGKAAEKYQLLE